ncbi:MAG: AAA family ATPase, partial [Muribaculaceae bacterium]|nr:AAA family ATPase [Muribaculaceae bacterium]
MTENDVIPLYTRARQKLRGISLRFHRYLYKFINWESRFIGIKGQRGVGKTIMMLQKLLETDPNMEKSLYVSLDDLWFSVNSLPDLVEYLYPRGITTFYLDEVHKYPEWSRVLKNLYDFYPDIHIIYSG